ncbi:MAG TPA: murein biosynthesis integral membrane protein MurJ, partial [Candidatus Hypogeohydataceae bacterium YC41]
MSDHSFISTARTVSLCTLLSRILGLLRDVLCASFFGTGLVWDAFAVAFRVPNLFRRLFGEGALTAAFVPTFTEYLEKKGNEEAWRLVSVVATVLATLLTLIVLVVETSLFVTLKSVSLEAKWEKTLELLAIMFPYSLLICLAALISAVLNCLKHFFMPALSPVILNLCWIGAMFFAAYSLRKGPEEGIYLVAVAVLVAGFLQLGLQWLVVYNNGGRILPLVELSHPGLKEIATNMGPVVFGLAVIQINVLVDSLVAVGFASPPGGPTSFEFLGEVINFPLKSGAASVLYYGDRLMEFPSALIGVAMATAIFPTLSVQSVRGDMSGFSETLKRALSIVLFAGIPAAVGLAILRDPMVELFFQRKAFTLESTQRTAWVIGFYSIGLWAFCIMHILVRAFHSMKDTFTPAKIGASMVGLNLVLNLVFVWFLREGGLALATSLCAILQATLLFSILHRRLKLEGMEKLMASCGKTLVATAIMALICLATLCIVPPSGGTFWVKTERLFLPVLSGLIGFLGTAYLLGSEELSQLYYAFGSKKGH